MDDKIGFVKSPIAMTDVWLHFHGPASSAVGSNLFNNIVMSVDPLPMYCGTSLQNVRDSLHSVAPVVPTPALGYRDGRVPFTR